MRTVKGGGLAELKRLRTKTAPPDNATPAEIDNRKLFRSAVKSVQPIKDSKRTLLPPLPAASEAILRQRRVAAAGESEARPAQVSDHYSPAGRQIDNNAFVRAGCGPDLIKGLKRGKWPVGASLDLHGATLEQARARLDQFLQSCLTHHIKCVCIIHGKGYGSKGGTPVLKQTVRRWLTQIDPVIAYTECREQNGGAGAVLALLRTGD